jgi:hypothetical protein
LDSGKAALQSRAPKRLLLLRYFPVVLRLTVIDGGSCMECNMLCDHPHKKGHSSLGGGDFLRGNAHLDLFSPADGWMDGWMDGWREGGREEEIDREKESG